MSAAVTMYYTASSACMIWAYKLKPLFPSLPHLHPPQLLLLHLDRMNGLVLLTVRALTPKMVYLYLPVLFIFIFIFFFIPLQRVL